MGRTKKRIEKEYVPIKKELFKFQKELIENSNANYMYITDTGTGKTMIALHHFLKHKKNDNTKLLVVAPAQKVKEKGWEREIKDLFFSENTSFEYEILTYNDITKRVKDLTNIKVKKGESLLKKKAEVLKNEFENTFFVLDEAHYIKNKTSQRSKNISLALQKCQGWCMLTATPHPNGYIDMGVYFAIAGFYTSAYEFEKKHGTYDEGLLRHFNARVPMRDAQYWKNKDIIDGNFQKIASPPLKKEECLDLPKLTKIINYFQPSTEYKELTAIFDSVLFNFNSMEYSNASNEEVEKALIDKISTFKLEDARVEIEKRKAKEYNKKNIDELKKAFYEEIDDELLSVPKIFALARQFANIEDKTDFLCEFLEGTRNNVLVFYNFNIELEFMLNAIKNNTELAEKKIYQINGKYNDIPDFDEFKDIENSITFVQIQAGGAGIELQYCNEVIYFSPTWSYQDYYQSLGRAYRQGQKRNVVVYEYIVNDSIEEYIKGLLNNKKSFDKSMFLKMKFNKF